MRALRNTKGKKVLCLALILAMLLPMLPTTNVYAESVSVHYDGIFWSYDYDGSQSSSDNSHGVFTTTFGGGIVFCGQHNYYPDLNVGETKTFTAEPYTHTKANINEANDLKET